MGILCIDSVTLSFPEKNQFCRPLGAYWIVLSPILLGQLDTLVPSALKGNKFSGPPAFWSPKFASVPCTCALCAETLRTGGGGPTLNAKSHDSFPFFWSLPLPEETTFPLFPWYFNWLGLFRDPAQGWSVAFLDGHQPYVVRCYSLFGLFPKWWLPVFCLASFLRLTSSACQNRAPQKEFFYFKCYGVSIDSSTALMSISLSQIAWILCKTISLRTTNVKPALMTVV